MQHHIPGNPPELLFWQECVHRPTRQRYAVLNEGCSVETDHGTMVGRKGDILMEGANGTVYVLTREAFEQVYEQR